MTKKVKIIALAGSTRKDSFNKKLIREAVKSVEAAGADVTLIDLADYPMPLYDGDDEAASGLPENAKKLKQLFVDSDGIMIASPEYNSSYSGVLKNTIDWISRGEGNLIAFTGKYAALMAASPGALGGLRGLFALRELLQNINVTVLPSLQAVGQAGNAFDEAGNLKDEKTAEKIAALGKSLVETLLKMKA